MHASTLAITMCTVHRPVAGQEMLELKQFKGSPPKNVKTDPKSMNMTLSDPPSNLSSRSPPSNISARSSLPTYRDKEIDFKIAKKYYC